MGRRHGRPERGFAGVLRTYDATKKAIFNTSVYSNPDLDKRIDDLAFETDMAKRVTAQRAILALIANEMPLIPLYSTNVIAASKRTINYRVRSDEMTFAMEAEPAR